MNKMYDFLYGSKTVINNEFLEKNGIPVIDKRDINIDKTSFLATTGSGKFYKGKYLNENISIKIIDISHEYEMISEFFYWKEFKNKDCFLHFLGAYTLNSEGYLIFENFTCTLEQALNGRLIKDDNKMHIIQSVFRILDSLQKGKKIHRDFRPGNIGFNEKKQVKLLDFGFLTNEKLANIDYVEKYRPKYSPPETLNDSNMFDLKNDIWSFGCIMIDLFSKENPIYKISITKKEIIESKKFPSIPKDIIGLPKDIIARCLDPNYETRISIYELENIMNVLFNNMTRSTLGEDLNKRLENNKELKEINEYIDDLDDKITDINKLITEDLLDNTISLKRNMITANEEINSKINDNYSLIKTQMQEIVHKKFEFLNIFYDKILESTMLMQQSYGECMADTIEATNVINDMKLSISSLSQLENPALYKNLYVSLIKNRENLSNHVKNYSEKKEYDKIMNSYDQNIKLFDEFKIFCNVEELYLSDIKNYLKKHNEEYTKKSRIKELSKLLNLSVDVDVSLKKYDIFFAKVQENSNLLIIFDYDEKIFQQIKINDLYFNTKCCTLFIDKKVYYSGGLTNTDEPSDDFSYLRISRQYNEFEFDKIKQPNLLYQRYSHSMINYKNYILFVGGKNTKSCEIFETVREISKPFPNLPTICSNPALTIINDEFLFCFSGSQSFDSREGIFRISLKNLDKIIFSNDAMFQDVLYWDSLDYVFDVDNGILKRGMMAVQDRDSIILLGGFDNDRFYNNIYQVKFDLNINQNKNVGEGVIINNDFKDKEKDKQHDKNGINAANVECLYIYESEHLLPNFTFFNTNYFAIEGQFIFIDGFNNGLEINPKKFEINYYT